MKAAAIGVATAVIALGLYIWGFNVGMKYEQYYERYGSESAQMQCIHWVERWKGEPTPDNPKGNPNFGMFTSLCGKPDSK